MSEQAVAPPANSPRKKRLLWRVVQLAVLALVLIAIVLDRNEPPPEELPPGSFAFAVLGDAPYYPWEEIRFRRLLRQMNASDLASVVHIGDIFWQPCTEEKYRRHLAYFQSVRHPVIYTPGDNEWTDCHEERPGRFLPLTRLAMIRDIFFSDPAHSLGGTPLTLTVQGGEPPFEEFVEHARWEHEGIVFAAVHIVGSLNGGEQFAGRTDADDIESRRRTAASAAWVREAFSIAREADARAVVILFHANLLLHLPVDAFGRQAFEPFITALEEEAEAFPRPVLLAQGSDHEYIVDKPLVRRTTGETLDNVTRLQVSGSPDVGWVRVIVTPAAADADLFRFEEYVMPAWKVW